MISIPGEAIGFDQPEVCRVSFQNSNNDHDYLYSLNSDCYSNPTLKSCNDKEFRIDSSEIQLNDGDLLFIQPQGIATKIYDVTSTKNSLFLTEECNCRCMSCPQPPIKNDSIDWVKVATSTVRLIKSPPLCLGITGGEPTIKWDGLLEVLDDCSKFLPETIIQLLTNGRIFKNFKRVNELSQFEKTLSIGVPLHSDVDEIHDKLAGRRGAFWETIAGLHNLERAKIPIELRVVVSKENVERLPQLSEFIYKMLPFVQYVAFMAQEPIGRALKNFNRLWIDPSDYQLKLEKAIRFLWKRGIESRLFNYQLCVLSKELRGLSVQSISEWKIKYIDECEECIEKVNCGGFFFSSVPFKSNGIKAIR